MRVEGLKLFRLLLAGLCFMALAGCSTLLPSKRTENASITTAEKISASHDLAISRAIEGEKRPALPVAPNISVSGSSNRVEVTLYRVPEAPAAEYRENLSIKSEASQGANSNETAASRFKVSLPLGVSLILIGLGLLLLVFAWRKVRQSSAAISAAYGAADQVIADRIHRTMEKAMATSDAGDLAKINAEVASLQADRNKLK